jgi:hypothetical protein
MIEGDIEATPGFRIEKVLRHRQGVETFLIYP